MAKRPLAVLLGITGNLAFAAGCLLQAVRRHSPELAYDAFIYHDGTVLPSDAALLKDLGARLIPFHVPFSTKVGADFIAQCSLLAFARFECLKLLRRYRHVVYFDVDIAVQDDISSLLGYGPLGVTYEDRSFMRRPTYKAGCNFSQPVPGIIADAPGINSGVIVFNDELPNPEELYLSYCKWIDMYASRLIYWDQAILTLLAHRLEAMGAGIVQYMPTEKYNTHPYSANAVQAVLLHAFGPNKFWNDALMCLLCPEWARDYARWVAKGGSLWTGLVRNTDAAQGGAYAMILRFLTQEKEYQAQLEDRHKQS
jgi:hypothetical protein